MKRLVMLSSALLGVIFLVGCGQQPVDQVQTIIPTPKAQQPNPKTEAQQKPAQATLQPNAETPVVEKDVTKQPAYLIAAYTKNGKNYIDVDYIEWLHGENSIKAQVEDAECTSASECYDYPNGYKRNQNPKVRTFEVSSLVFIKVNGEIAAKINDIEQTHLGDPYGRNLEITFEKLTDIVSKMESYLPYNSPFKEPKAFIAIDVKDNIVTNIVEPYQE